MMPNTKQAYANLSVIIPCYQCVDTIERCVNSVLVQRLLPKEIILIDDASDDGTSEKLKMLQASNTSQVTILVQGYAQNKGPSTARNLGWHEATGDYIAFLDADDSWHPDKVYFQYRWMLENDTVDLSCHLTSIHQGEVGQATTSGVVAERLDAYGLLLQNKVATRTVMLKRDLPYRFDNDKRLSEDYLLWLTMAFANCHLCRLNQILAYSYKPDFGHSGLTSNLLAMECAELDTFNQLLKANAISWYWWLLAVVFSAVKFIRRILLRVFSKVLK